MTTVLSHPRTFPPGRLEVLSAMGAATGAVPLPFLPSRMLSAIRGALVHDVCSRHGLLVSSDARRLLAQADSVDPRRAKLISLATYFGGRFLRFLGPLRLLTPALAAIETFTLGHLLDRYLERARTSNTVRIQVEEARLIRLLIDRALLRCLAVDLKVAREKRSDGAPSEDSRDDMTRVVDALLLTSAGLPAYFVRRLEAAFDEVVMHTPEIK